MTVRVKVSERALRTHLRTTAEPQAALDRGVAMLKDRAEQYAPDKTGYFRRRFRTRKFPLSRRLYNTDWFGHLVEFGSINNPAYSPMRRAARSLGFKFKAGTDGKR